MTTVKILADTATVQRSGNLQQPTFDMFTANDSSRRPPAPGSRMQNGKLGMQLERLFDARAFHWTDMSTSQILAVLETMPLGSRMRRLPGQVVLVLRRQSAAAAAMASIGL